MFIDVRRRKQLSAYRKKTLGYWRLKEGHWIAHCGKLALEEAVDL